jgi:hypothetical protein
MKRAVIAVIMMFVLYVPVISYGACGGTERWFVKVGTDPDAANVDIDNVVSISVQELNNLPGLRDEVPHNDNKTRLEAERVVYKVTGRLVLFKCEDDGDYHLVITDDSLNYTPGGAGTNGLETGTSFIAEIPNPDCVAGKKGDPDVPSVFDEQLKNVKEKFEGKFACSQADSHLGGVPVTITGVLFYDRQHLQTGRAVNGAELHPLLDISFDGDGVPATAIATPVNVVGDEEVTQLIANPGFEDGVTGWNGTVSDIGNFEEKAHRGDSFVWMGGSGHAHTQRLYQNVSLPSDLEKASLSFWIKIDTEEITTEKAYDKLYIQIDKDGKVIETLITFSNLDTNNDYAEQTFDVSKYIGKDIQVSMKSVEDNGKATSFKLDDITITGYGE